MWFTRAASELRRPAVCVAPSLESRRPADWRPLYADWRRGDPDYLFPLPGYEEVFDDAALALLEAAHGSAPAYFRRRHGLSLEVRRLPRALRCSKVTSDQGSWSIDISGRRTDFVYGNPLTSSMEVWYSPVFLLEWKGPQV